MEVDQLSEKRVKGKVAGSRVGLLEVSVWQPLKEAPACREDTVKPILRRAFATEEHVLAVTEECPATQVVCAFCVELCGARAGRWKIPRMRRKTNPLPGLEEGMQDFGRVAGDCAEGEVDLELARDALNNHLAQRHFPLSHLSVLHESPWPHSGASTETSAGVI